jgi:hypothetical protein
MQAVPQSRGPELADAAADEGAIIEKRSREGRAVCKHLSLRAEH